MNIKPKDYTEIKSFNKICRVKIDNLNRFTVPKVLRELLKVSKGDHIRIGYNPRGELIVKK